MNNQSRLNVLAIAYDAQQAVRRIIQELDKEWHDGAGEPVIDCLVLPDGSLTTSEEVRWNVMVERMQRAEAERDSLRDECAGLHVSMRRLKDAAQAPWPMPEAERLCAAAEAVPLMSVASELVRAAKAYRAAATRQSPWRKWPDEKPDGPAGQGRYFVETDGRVYFSDWNPDTYIWQNARVWMQMPPTPATEAA